MPVIELELDSKGAIKGLQQFDNQIDRTSRAITNTGTKSSSAFATITKGVLALGAAFAGIAIVDKFFEIGKASVDAAARMEEAENKYGVVFDGMTATSDAWVQNLRDNYALSEVAAKTYLASMKVIIDATGLAEDASADLSNRVVILAQDLASFHDRTVEDSIRAVTGALTGEYEMMKSFGVVVNKTKIDLKALELARRQGTEVITDGIRAEAAYQLILEKNQDAIGDTIRSHDTYTFQLKQLQAIITDVKVTIGNALLPVLKDMVTEFNAWFRANQELVKQNIRGIVEDIAAGFRLAYDALKLLVDAYRTWVGWMEKRAILKMREDLGAVSEELTRAKDGILGFGKASEEEVAKVQEKYDNLLAEIKKLESEGKPAIDAASGAVDNLGTSLHDASADAKALNHSIRDTGTAAKESKPFIDNQHNTIKADKEKIVRLTEEQVKTEGVLIIKADQQKKILDDTAISAEKVSRKIGDAKSSIDEAKESALQFEESMARAAEAAEKTNVSMSGSVSAHGGQLTDEQWQGLPSYTQDLLSKQSLSGSSSYHYFNKGVSGFGGGPGGTGPASSDWAESNFRGGGDSSLMGTAVAGMVGGTIVNNFTQSVTRSDVVNIIEEMQRSLQRA